MIKKQFLIDKVTALFVVIQQKYGIGDVYESKLVNGFGHHFSFTNIIFCQNELSVGIYHGKGSVTVLFCEGPDAFKFEKEGTVIHDLSAGITGPNPYYYPFKIIMNCSVQRPKITVMEIIENLGNISAVTEIPKDPVLEIILLDDGSIAEIKKHL